MKIKKLNEAIQHCWFGYYIDKDGNQKYFYMTKDSTSKDPDEASDIMEDSIPEPFTKFVFQGSVANTQAEKQGWKLVESKTIREARRKASDPKQIEKAEKAMFDSLMNGAYNTEWMIQDARMIYGISYDEAVKAFRNAHNKYMIMSGELDESKESEESELITQYINNGEFDKLEKIHNGTNVVWKLKEPVTESIKVGDKVKVSTPGNNYYDGRIGMVDYAEDNIITVKFDDDKSPKMNNFDLNQVTRIDESKSVNNDIEVETIGDYITDHYDFDDIDDKYSCINSIRDSFKDGTISKEELEQFIGAHNGKDKVNEASEGFQKEFYNGYVILKNRVGDGWDIYSYDGTPEKVTKAHLEDKGFATLQAAKDEIDKWNGEAKLDESTQPLYIIKDRNGNQLSAPNPDDGELWDRVASMEARGRTGLSVVAYIDKTNKSEGPYIKLSDPQAYIDELDFAGAVEIKGDKVYADEETLRQLAGAIAAEYGWSVSINEALNEASYGGAFDIRDDQYFTREDIENAAEEVMGHITETFTEPYHLGGTWFENGQWIVNVQGEQFDEYEVSIPVDMRKIKEPWHLKRAYASEMAAKLIAQIKEYNDMNEAIVPSSFEFDDDVDDLSYYYDDEVFKNNLENDPYTEIASKQVPDSDGFMTDYTMYRNINDGTYVFIFGDKDVYTPDNGDFDWSCDTEAEAQEWFNNYTGFADEDIDWVNDDSVNESLEADLKNRYTVSDAHNNKSVLSNIDSLSRSELIGDIEPVVKYGTQMFEMISTDNRLFYLVPVTMSQFDIYDANENLISKSEFTRYIVDEILMDKSNIEFIYEIVGGDCAGVYSREELETLPCFSGKYTEDQSNIRANGGFTSREELDNQPVLNGYVGPMMDGWKNHKMVIRYETQEVYNALSH